MKDGHLPMDLEGARERYAETAEFDGCTCTKETAKAILVKCNGQSSWIPKSQVHEDSEVFGEGHDGKLVVALWWAEREALFEG